MIRPSPEILSLARRLFDAGRDRDAPTLRNLYAGLDITRFVGSGPRECWSGNAVRNGLGAHFGEVPVVLADEEVLAEAFEDGGTGWAFFIRRYEFAGIDEPRTMRFTLVYTLENGVWKIVHRHASVGIENLALHGAEQRALEDLMQAAQSENGFAGETGVATVMFTDIAGSTTLAASLGDRLWADTVRGHIAGVGGAIEAEGGKLVKSLGDGTMSAFSSAGAAMRAAIRLQREMAARTTEPRLQVRIGLHTGDVVDAGDDFFGTVVNKAARVTGFASPDDILVSDATRAMVGGSPEFVFSDAVPVTLKGLEGTHVVHRLEWRA